MESFYSQLLTVLLVIISILIFIFSYRKVFSAMDSTDCVDIKKTDDVSCVSERIHPRNAQVDGKPSEELHNDE